MDNNLSIHSRTTKDLCDSNLKIEPLTIDNLFSKSTKAREYKRVKHHHKDAIREVREISFKEFIELRLLNKNDPYLRCKNVQQQRKVVGLEERIEEDEYLLSKRNSLLPNRCTAYKLKKMVIQLKDVVGQMCDAYLEDIAV